ncbi:MAG: hypothetical protein L3J57_11145 [Desulfuromusa sp.]|nr:hypothetical protein [Desulfuromusa sp.]
MGGKLISLAFVLCLIFLPAQLFACGGGDSDDGLARLLGFGPPLNFTPPPVDSDFGIPESYTDLGVAGSSVTLPAGSSMTLPGSEVEDSYDALESVGKGLVISGKVAIAGIGLIGGVAGILSMAPATVATAGTVAALGLVAEICGGTAVVAGALMQGAETYGKNLDKGMSQTDAMRDGMTNGIAKGAIDHAINLNPGFGTIDLMQKATTGKGINDTFHEGVTSGVAPNTPMTPIDA